MKEYKQYVKGAYPTGCNIVGSTISSTFFGNSYMTNFLDKNIIKALDKISGGIIGLGGYLKSYSYMSKKIDDIDEYVKKNPKKVLSVVTIVCSMGTIYFCLNPESAKKLIDWAKQKTIESIKTSYEETGDIFGIRKIVTETVDSGVRNSINYIFNFNQQPNVKKLEQPQYNPVP